MIALISIESKSSVYKFFFFFTSRDSLSFSSRDASYQLIPYHCIGAGLESQNLRYLSMLKRNYKRISHKRIHFLG